MKAISQFGEQSARQFTALPASTRMMAMLVVSIAVASALWTLSIYDQHDKTFILGKLTPNELASAKQAFVDAGLDDAEIVDGSRLKVPTSKQEAYLAAWTSTASQRTQDAGESSFASQPSMFESTADRQWRQQLQRERNLERILCRRPQVDSAFVEYDEVKEGFTREYTRTCCIQVQQNNNQPIPDSVLENIRETATAYFAGLKSENVSVIDIGSSHTGQTADSSAAQRHPVLNLKAEWEQYYHQKVSELLSDFQNVKIGVTVTFDSQTAELVKGRDSQMETPQTEVRSTTWRRLEVRSPDDEQLLNQASDIQQPQSSLNRPQSIVTRTEETEETKLVRSESVPIDDRIKNVLPSTVSISIGIPESHYLRIHRWKWDLANRNRTEKHTWSPPKEDELELIRQQANEEVRAAISNIPETPTGANSPKQPAINVYAYTDVPVVEVAPMDWMQRTESWISDSWKSIVLIGLTIICLGLMFVWMRSPSPSSNAELNTISDMDAATESLYQSVDSGFSESDTQDSADDEPEQIKRDLSALVREHPDAAKKLLKSWLGDAA